MTVNYTNIRRAAVIGTCLTGIFWMGAKGLNELQQYRLLPPVPEAPVDPDKDVKKSTFNIGSYFTDFSTMPLAEYVANRTMTNNESGHFYLYNFKENTLGAAFRNNSNCRTNGCEIEKTRLITLKMDETASAPVKAHFNDMRVKADKIYGKNIPATLIMRLSNDTVTFNKTGNYWFEDRAHDISCVVSFAQTIPAAPAPVNAKEDRSAMAENIRLLSVASNGNCIGVKEARDMLSPSRPDYILDASAKPVVAVPTVADAKPSAPKL